MNIRIISFIVLISIHAPCLFGSIFLNNAVWTSSNGVVTITGFPLKEYRGVLEVPDKINGEPVIAIGYKAFANCNASSIILPEGLRRIEYGAFWSCAIESIRLPNSLVSIGELAFQSCDFLEEIIFPPNLISIGNEAFIANSRLEFIYFEGDAPTLGADVFYLINHNANIYVNENAIGFGSSIYGYPVIYERASLVDVDGDGLYDLYETNTGIFVSNSDTGTDPLEIDTDGDGLNDSIEINIYLSNPNLFDSDNDGLSDLVESNLIGVRFQMNSNNSRSIEILRNNGFLTAQDIQDLRAGSTMIPVDNNEALIQLKMEQSADLQDWTQIGDTITYRVPAEESTKYIRFKMAD